MERLKKLLGITPQAIDFGEKPKVDIAELEARKKVVKQALIDAVEKLDADALVEAIQEVNELFTPVGRDMGASLEQLKHAVNEFINSLKVGSGRDSKIFYLNDGGISRLQIDTLTGKVRLELTDSSDADLKADWSKY
ncbi:MAG: hypothetical protein IT416_03085 [Candidatus Pacebacteria bacterium]|nr:hypothetical protein [Candidatus Paceibacterota bacterium]